MRQCDLLCWGAILVVLAVAGCGKHNAKPGRVKGIEQVAADYNFHDSPATRERLELQEKLGLAQNRLQAGDDAAAEVLVRFVLNKQPQSVEALTLLAVIQSARGEAAAGETYRRAADLAPQQGNVLNNYGAWLCAAGHPAEALPWFDRAIADPHYAPAAALANAGDCALRAGQHTRGLRDLRQALELDPGNACALEAMARYQYQSHNYFQARAFAERRLEAAPPTASMLQLAMKIEQGLGDKAAASRYQQRLAREFPDTAAAHTGANAL